MDLVGAGAEVGVVGADGLLNIVRRDTLGVPSHLLGIALKRAPGAGDDHLSRVMCLDLGARPVRGSRWAARAAR